MAKTPDIVILVFVLLRKQAKFAQPYRPRKNECCGWLGGNIPGEAWLSPISAIQAFEFRMLNSNSVIVHQLWIRCPGIYWQTSPANPSTRPFGIRRRYMVFHDFMSRIPVFEEKHSRLRFPTTMTSTLQTESSPSNPSWGCQNGRKGKDSSSYRLRRLKKYGWYSGAYTSK